MGSCEPSKKIGTQRNARNFSLRFGFDLYGQFCARQTLAIFDVINAALRNAKEIGQALLCKSVSAAVFFDDCHVRIIHRV